MRNAEKGALYRSTIRIAAGLGTLAMLATPVSAEIKQVIECGTGQKTETRHIPDGTGNVISDYPDYVVLFSRPDGGVIVRSQHDPRNAPTQLALGNEYRRRVADINIDYYVPSNRVNSQGYYKDHEITIRGRTEDNRGNVVQVKGICLDNAPKK